MADSFYLFVGCHKLARNLVLDSRRMPFLLWGLPRPVKMEEFQGEDIAPGLHGVVQQAFLLNGTKVGSG